MPDKLQILHGLTSLTSRFSALAALWHIALFLLMAVWIWRRPSTRFMLGFLGLMLASVGALAWTARNPFNGIVFLALAAAFVYQAAKANRPSETASGVFFLITGSAMILFGLFYPHFVRTETWLTYLAYAPVGLIPCPTLSLVTGFFILQRGFGSKALTLIVIAAGFFYAIFGIAKLGVTLDAGLLAGAAVLLAQLLANKKPKAAASAE
ncbi:MAG: hypothetical protein NTZ26_02785 [Candidatus Aminicenantes bacterium]|nr:hypothetical protein [Candidatus Aminicenantes bacterium]